MIIKVKILVFCENFMSTGTFTKCNNRRILHRRVNVINKWPNGQRSLTGESAIKVS